MRAALVSSRPSPACKCGRRRHADERRAARVCAVERERTQTQSRQANLVTRRDGSQVDIVTYNERRWSNLAYSDQNLVHAPGTIFGAAALVAGTTIGAGILALPEITKCAGFGPSCATLVGFYVFSALTGLLITEVNLNTVCELGSGSSSLQAMVKRTLGAPGARVAAAAYTFLHISLLTAYGARAGGSIASLTSTPVWLASAGFTASLGGLCYFSSSKVLDVVNSSLLGAVILSFLFLLAVATPGIDVANFVRSDWSAIPDTLPVVALAFVYQNVVPVIVSSLEGDVPRVRAAIWIGLSIPLLMFVGWEGAMIGSLPSGAVQDIDPVLLLRQSNASIGPVLEAFSLLAIATSFIGFVLGLSDFFSDVFDLRQSRAPAYALTLFPPYALALSFPDLFFTLLDLAGTYGVLVLFGVLPAAMAWQERYASEERLSAIRAVGGGRGLLIGVGAVAGGIIANELFLVVKPMLLR